MQTSIDLATYYNLSRILAGLNAADSDNEAQESQDTVEGPRESTDKEEMLSRFANMQAKFRDTAGRVPAKQEVTMRAELSRLFLQFGSQFQEQQPIEDAIQHLDAILRHTPENSPDRPEYLDALSHAKFELYRQTNSRHNLALAVLYGRQARDLASTTGLSERDAELYIKILTNLGHVLAYQHRLLGRRKDVEDSIACKREILALAPMGSESYHLALNNLAATLHRQYISNHREEDNTEAQRLIKELLDSTTVGTKIHSIAVGQLGTMSLARFKQTRSQEDLEDALIKCKATFEAIDTAEDAWSEILEQIVWLSNKRHEFTQDPTDMKDAVQYSTILFDSIPAGHNSRGEGLMKHLFLLNKYASVSQSTEVIDDVTKLSKVALSKMPPSYPAKTGSQVLLSHILSRRYIVSGSLVDLRSLVDLTTTVLTDYNTEIKSGTSQRAIPDDWIRDLARTLGRICSIPLEVSVVQDMEEEIFGAFVSCYDGDLDSPPHQALCKMYAHNSLRWQIMADAGKDNLVLSDTEIEAQINKIKNQRAAERVQREAESAESKRRLDKWPYKPENYQTEFGLRSMAMDPETHNIIFDIDGLFIRFLGYDPEPVSPDEFVAREVQMEQKALEQGRSEGKHPNPRLCRLCRNATRLIQPTTDGFELSAKRCMLPTVGEWRMVLFCRSECAICSLVASLITTSSGNLHPEFEKADLDARGLRPSSGRLSSGESVLRVDFGVTWAGELRILTSSNFRQALRQAWETDAEATLHATMADVSSPVHTLDRQQVNLALIKRWLADCDHNHGSACNYPRPGNRINSEIPLYLIDVIQECIVPGTSKQRYFALSYTWGSVDMCVTRLENVEGRRQPQALSMIPFPKTIRDAMRLVRSLGERFLWIDAVCIAQDDLIQKARDIPNMHIVYGKAFATIAALHGSDADAGLPGVAPGTRSPQRIETVVVSNKSRELEYDPSCGNNEEIHIVATPRPLHLVLKAANWNTRGWIVQERLLSRRMLYFWSDAVYFQCGQHTLSEGGVNEEVRTFLIGSALKDEHRLRKANHENPIADLDLLHDLDTDLRLLRALAAYVELVETYSKREFTYKGDVIDGFLGVFAVLDEQHFQGLVESKTLHGLPGSIFVHALMWSPAARIPRRGARFAKEDDLVSGTLTADITKPDPRFPSWSWAGWDGPVEYRLFDWATDVAERPVPLVNEVIVGDLEISPDKFSKSSSLSEVSASERKGKQTVVKEDATQPDYPKDPSSGPSTSCSDRDQESEVTSGAQETSENRIWKGKEKETQETRTRAKIWRDPDTNKIWAWVTPPNLEVDRMREPPSAANVLRMRGPAVLLSAFKVAAHKQYLSVKTHLYMQGSQSVRRIYDGDGNHCGLWWEQGGYQWVGNSIYPETEKALVLVGVSSYGVCYRPREGPFRVEGRISMFDHKVYPSVGENSGLVNILVVDENVGYQDGTGERCTIAVMHIKAWEQAGPVERQVRLA